MEHPIEQLGGAGFAAITLTVTEANQQAVRLYQSLGFRVRHQFDAMVKDTSATRRDSSALRG
jgi:ribosomal protein S18 acetylase RimI-like enzyme